MRARSSLTEAQRDQLVELFDQGMGSRTAARELNVSRDAVRRLKRRYDLHGRLCLVEKPIKQQYSFEIKKEIVDRFTAGETKMALAREFGLSSDQLVSTWVRAWRAGGDAALKPKKAGRPKGPTAPKPLSDLDKIRRENEKLKAENAYLKKLRDLRSQGRS